MKPATHRGRATAVLAISAVVLFLVAGGASDAATVAHFLTLGKTTKTTKATGLSSRNQGHPTLALANTGGQPAASFSTLSSTPPFSVNSTAKVLNLDADLLDGLDSSQLQRAITGSCAAGSAIQTVGGDGTVTCATIPSLTVAPAWDLAGNSGTNPASDFLGTADAEPLIVKTDGNEALRVTAAGDVGVGTRMPVARLEGFAGGGSETAVRGVTAGGTGIAGVSTSGPGVTGQSDTGDGVDGTSSTHGVVGSLTGASCPTSTYAVGGCGGATGEGVLGDSNSRGVIGTLGGTSCPGTYAVGGCGAAIGDGVVGSSSTNGVVGISSHNVGGGTAAAVVADNTGTGDIFLAEGGVNGRVARIDQDGIGYFDGGTQNGGADYAESVRAVDRAALHPGDVLAIAPAHGYAVDAARGRYSPLLIGVYSTKPAVLAVGNHGVDASLAGEVPVAMMGVVPTEVTAINGAIRPGDLLTSSSIPGYAMRATPTLVHGLAIYPTGTILGKALQPLSSGRGEIQVLLMAR
jgi:hypothetical protein